MKLSILEFCAISSPMGEPSIVQEIISLASMADKIGYTRFWITEHHTSYLDASPELLAAVVASKTRHIMVGVGGILLNYYSPIKIASSFGLLETIFPGRVNLGVCRGRAPAPTDAALIGDQKNDMDMLSFEKKTLELVRYLRGDEKLYSAPSTLASPKLWLLGSGWNSMKLAAKYGTSYSHSLFHKGALEDPSILSHYRENFQNADNTVNSENNDQITLAVAGICAETSKRAKMLLDACENPFIVPKVVGSPLECKAALLELAEQFKVDEILFLDLSTTSADHYKSYELLGKEFFK